MTGKHLQGDAIRIAASAAASVQRVTSDRLFACDAEQAERGTGDAGNRRGERLTVILTVKPSKETDEARPKVPRPTSDKH